MRLCREGVFDVDFKLFPTTINSRINYSKLLGRRSFEAGYENLALKRQVDDTNPLYGLDLYGGGCSRPEGGAGGKCKRIHDFLRLYFCPLWRTYLETYSEKH